MKYSDIEDAFQFVSSAQPFEHSAYLKKETLETYYVSEMGDSDELPGDLEENDNYVGIPHKNDLDLGLNLVLSFISAKLPNELEKVRGIFRSRGAYARFKDLLEQKGQLEVWYEYEKKATEEALREWCKESGVTLAD